MEVEPETKAEDLMSYSKTQLDPAYDVSDWNFQWTDLSSALIKNLASSESIKNGCPSTAILDEKWPPI